MPTEETPRPSSCDILLVLLLVVAGTTVRWGAFSWEGLALMLCATGLCFWLHMRPASAIQTLDAQGRKEREERRGGKRSPGWASPFSPLPSVGQHHCLNCSERPAWQGPSTESFLAGIVVAFIALICVLKSGRHESMLLDRLPLLGREFRRLNGYGLAIKLLSAGALLIGLSYVTRVEGLLRKLVKCRFALLVVVAVALRVLMLFSTPEPHIDVFISQTEGAKGLLEGKNVYAMEFLSPYTGARTFDHYGYPPAAFYPAFLSWFCFKDVRAGWLLCDLLAAFLMFRLALRVNPGPEHKRFRELLLLAFLFLPRTLFVLEQSWTEPLVLVSLAGFALAVASGRGAGLTGCLLGLWLGSKQYVTVAIPFILKLRRCRTSTWGVAAITGVVLALPFALWDFAALKHDVFDFFLQSRGREDALSIYGALMRHGYQMPWWLVTPIWLAGLAWFTWKMQRHLAGWLFSTAGMWLFFFMLGKQAFMNYFYLIMFTLLLAVAATPQTASDASAEDRS